VASALGAPARTAVSPSGSLGEIIARITGRPAEFRAETKLEDLGLSSIDRVELMSALEDRYQVDLDEAQFSAATTIGEIERIIQSGGHVEGPAGAAMDARPTAAATPPDASRKDQELAHSGARQFVYPRWAQRWPVTWLRTAIYWLASWPATMIMARPKIVGREHLRGVQWPVMIVSNHITQLDIGFIYAALPARRRTRLAVAMWGEMLRGMRRPPRHWNPLRRWYEMLRYYLVVGIFNVFPLPQQSGFRQSFAYAGESADRGFSLVVFPEGKRTTTGEMNPFRAGVGLLAERLGLPVLPVRIKGLFEYRYSGKLLVPPGTVTVHIGEPVRYPADADPQEIARDLERRMRAL
jgi:long-chain acyl-CoA synthetase